MAAHILLLTGGDPKGHPFDITAPLIREVLLSGGFELVEDHNLDRIKQATALAEFDAVVVHGLFPESGQLVRDHPAEIAFRDFVHGGKGLVVVHIASNSFEGSPRWRKLLGRVWEYGDEKPFTSSHPEPPGPFDVNIMSVSHPITQDMADFHLDSDERYQDLLVAPNMTTLDLASATLEGRTEPVAWVLTPPEGGRVFHTTLGHERSTYENEGFKMLLNRGVAWAAGELT